MVQFLENKKMIFHFMDVDYFLLLLLKKLIFFSKTSKKWRAPGSRQVFQIPNKQKNQRISVNLCFFQRWGYNWAITQPRSWNIHRPNLEFIKPNDPEVCTYKRLPPNIAFPFSENYACL